MMFPVRRVPAAVLLSLATLALGSAGCSSQKILVEKADDLPPHTYQVEGKATDYLTDDAKLMKLAAALEKDLLSDLDKYEIPDKTTLQGYYGSLGMIALLEGRNDDYRRYRTLSLALEEKEAQRLVSGLFTLSYLEAVEEGAVDLDAAIADKMRARMKDLPYDVVGDLVKSSKGQAEIVSQTLMEGGMESRTQPIIDQAGGTVSKDIAQGLVRSGYTVRRYLPYKHILVDVYGEYLDAHAVVKEDIWAARVVDLEPGKGLAPVLISVWDSGVDVPIFGDLIWTNEAEVAGNGKDDDGNGFVDDVHGIAYTLHADKTPELLYPIGEMSADRATLQRLSKGLSDLTSNIDSEESDDVKRTLAGLQRDEVKPFIENLGAYGGYSHGTHVTGIAVDGNPYVEVLVARMTYPHEMIPEKPTITQARKDSTMFQETVQYFRDHGVRVVNMSWGGNIASIESDLEAHDQGGDPEARKALARQIFEIGKAGLEKGIAAASEILFVTSAGNSNSDKEFDEFYPSSMVADNLMSVGAVDQAGDETSFTSFGKVDVYGNGFEVESFVPGGDRMKYNGTSMSSPQVVNVAAKLLAVNPALTPKELRDIIVSTADVRTAGEREIRLLNPKRALAMAIEG